jgi:hypothetical protein
MSNSATALKPNRAFNPARTGTSHYAVRDDDTRITALSGVSPQSGYGAPAAITATAAPAGGTGTAAGGWDTSGHRDTAIATINALVTDVTALQTELAALRTKLIASGVLT